MPKLPVLLLFFLVIIGSKGLAQNHHTVTFHVTVELPKKAGTFGIRGNIAPLNWEKTYALSDTDKDGTFSGDITFAVEPGQILEYKYVYGDKNITWELEAKNRILVISAPHLTVNDQWNLLSEIDLNSIPRLSADQLLRDFAIARKAIEEIHPGLYRYHSRAELDSIFDSFQPVFSGSMTYSEAFLHFTRFTAAIQCGHTFPSFYNQNVFISQIVLDQRDKLPLTFKILQGKMIVEYCVAPDACIPVGSEIVAINGVPSGVFLPETARLVKADGDNDAKRYADLSTFGVSAYYEAFDCYFPLLYPPVDTTYRISYRKPEIDATEEVTVKATSRKERESRLTAINPKHLVSADQLWKLEFWQNNTAYLQFGTFDVFQLSFEWDTFLKKAFADIKKRRTENVIIDIRWNEGGIDEVLMFIGKNIARSPIALPQRQDRVRYRNIPSELKPYLFTWDTSFYDLSARTKPLDEEYYILSNEYPQVIDPFPEAFQGKVYLLVNASNSSASFYLAEIARENHLATLIGETTGGSQQGLNAGTMFFLRLPNSQIEIDIPIIGSFSEDKPRGGIEPNLSVESRPSDIVNGTDPVTAAALRLINEK